MAIGSGFAPRPSGAKRWLWLVLGAVFVSGATAGAAYSLSNRTVKIWDGSEVRELRTAARTVDAALAEAGINLFPEDVTSPGLTDVLGADGTIAVGRARLVRVQVDDAPPQVLRTQARNVKEVLNSLGVLPSAQDRVLVNGQPGNGVTTPGLQAGAATLIEVSRAVDVTIAEAGKPAIVARTPARTVGEALVQNNYTIYLADRVNPPLNERLQPGMTIQLERAKVVDVLVDGRRVRTRTHRERVSDVLTDLNIILYDRDFTQPALNTAVGDQLQVQVVRVKRELEVTQNSLPFESLTQPDPELEIDNLAVKQEGTPGVRERRVQVTYENGAEVRRDLVADFVARPVQNKINTYGTKIVLRNLETPDGTLQYWRVIKMSATSYSASTAGVSRFAKNYGITRCGIAMRKGIVAVDPTLIPLRSNVYIPGYGQGLACDTGGAIVGRRIDLGYDDDNLVLLRRTTDVYILGPVPRNVKYILP